MFGLFLFWWKNDGFLSAKVPQFEAIATKFISFIDSVILNAFFPMHLTRTWNTTTKEMHTNSSQHPFAQIYYLQKLLGYFGAKAIFKNATQEWEGGVISLRGNATGSWAHSHPLPSQRGARWADVCTVQSR